MTTTSSVVPIVEPELEPIPGEVLATLDGAQPFGVGLDSLADHQKVQLYYFGDKKDLSSKKSMFKIFTNRSIKWLLSYVEFCIEKNTHLYEFGTDTLTKDEVKLLKDQARASIAIAVGGGLCGDVHWNLCTSDEWTSIKEMENFKAVEYLKSIPARLAFNMITAIRYFSTNHHTDKMDFTFITHVRLEFMSSKYSPDIEYAELIFTPAPEIGKYRIKEWYYMAYRALAKCLHDELLYYEMRKCIADVTGTIPQVHNIDSNLLKTDPNKSMADRAASIGELAKKKRLERALVKNMLQDKHFESTSQQIASRMYFPASTKVVPCTLYHHTAIALANGFGGVIRPKWYTPYCMKAVEDCYLYPAFYFQGGGHAKISGNAACREFLNGVNGDDAAIVDIMNRDIGGTIEQMKATNKYQKPAWSQAVLDSVDRLKEERAEKILEKLKQQEFGFKLDNLNMDMSGLIKSREKAMVIGNAMMQANVTTEEEYVGKLEYLEAQADDVGVRAVFRKMANGEIGDFEKAFDDTVELLKSIDESVYKKWILKKQNERLNETI